MPILFIFCRWGLIGLLGLISKKMSPVQRRTQMQTQKCLLPLLSADKGGCPSSSRQIKLSCFFVSKFSSAGQFFFLERVLILIFWSRSEFVVNFFRLNSNWKSFFELLSSIFSSFSPDFNSFFVLLNCFEVQSMEIKCLVVSHQTSDSSSNPVNVKFNDADVLLFNSQPRCWVK